MSHFNSETGNRSRNSEKETKLLTLLSCFSCFSADPGESLSKDSNRHSLDLPPGVYHIFMRANTEAGAGAAGPVVKVYIGGDSTL